MSAQAKPPTSNVVNRLKHIPIAKRGRCCPHCGSRYVLSQCIVISEPPLGSGLGAVQLFECPGCVAVDLRGIYRSGKIDSALEAELDLTAKLVTELRYGL